MLVNNFMKTCLMLLSMALLCGCSHQPAPKSFDEMDATEQMKYCRAQTDAAIREACTNAVPGIHAFVNVSADDASDAIVKWKGSAEFDYVNSVGGIDRTNLQFVFERTSYGTGRIFCLVDPDWEKQQWNEKQAKILSGTN